MLIKNVSVLYGKDLEFLPQTNLKISDQIIHSVGSSIQPEKKEEVFDGEGLLGIPGFINSHTHLGDSIAKDIGLDYDVDKKINPIWGFKKSILQNSKEDHLVSFVRNSCISMIKKGITTFVDFREGQLRGIEIITKAMAGLPIRSIILGRLEYYQDYTSIKSNTPLPLIKRKELSKLLAKCHGLGISGPNENSDSVLRYYSNTKKLKAIHSSETQESCKISKKLTGKTETQRALILRPDFLVHMTYASKEDLRLASKNKTSIIVCPRANASLAEGIPNVNLMLQCGCNVGIGTDNVMINSPDMFREMDYLWKVSMALNKKRISPKQILKMATVNAGLILRTEKIGSIEKGNFADCVFIKKHQIDLEPMHDPYASVVQRATESAIAAVMKGGKIIYGKI